METVSMALYKWKDKYYMQIIDNQYENFFITITERAAYQINAVNGCGIYTDMEILPAMVTD